MKIVYADGVFDEIIDIATYIARDNKAAAQRFIKACDLAFKSILRNPFMARAGKFRNPKLSEVRVSQPKGFSKYLILYIPTVKGVLILHVVHSAKNYEQTFERLNHEYDWGKPMGKEVW